MKNIFLFILTFISFSYLTEGQTYKLMTYNIRYDNPNDGDNQWSKRKEFLCDQIGFFDPDIFGIQEGLHHQVNYIDSTFSNYKFVGIGRDDGKKKGEYCAIFFNNEKFKVIKKSTFWLSQTPAKISVGWDASMERICTYVLLKNKITKQRFWVFNTHFDHIGEKARTESSKLILNKIKQLNQNDLPLLLMGDFNLKETSDPIRFLSKELYDSKTNCLLKPFGPVGTYNGFRFDQPVINRIDYIFTSKSNIQINKYAVLSDSKDLRYPSDHLPVYVEIEFK